MDRWKAELGRGREKRRVEERRSKKRKSQKKADADARKSRKVAKHCVFPMICGSAGSNSRLAKAAGAEPAGQMGDEKLHAIVARSTFPSQNVQNTTLSDHFWKLRCRKSAHRCGAKHVCRWKCTKHTIVEPLLEVQMSFRVAGARDCAPLQKWAKREGFVAFPKTMAGMGHLKRICKDAFSVAGAVQKTCSWEMLGGQGADYLRGVAFWSIRCAGLLRWFCVTGAALGMTWHQSSVAGAVLCTQLSIFEGSLAEFFRFWCFELRKNQEVSQNSFVFDVLNFEKSGSLAELLRFGCCQVQKMKTSRRIVSFWTLLCSNIKGSLAEFLRFWSRR